jgi:8-oxo-dGTP diphosphatase
MPDLSVAGIIYLNGKILLGKRKPGGHVGGLWEFPGGKIEGNESPQEALIREFKEELEIDIKVESKITEKIFTSPTKMFKLLAYYIIPKSLHFKNNEHTEINWFSIEDILKIEEIVDSDKLLLDDIKQFLAKENAIIENPFILK